MVGFGLAFNLGAIPDDPDLALQWALINTGQEIQSHVGVAGADIDATGAWVFERGDPSVVVAIVGTGVTPHPEFEARLLEGRGMVGDPFDSRDENGSGTHFAGILAAAADNATGMAGIAPRVQVLPIRVVNAGSTTATATAGGIRWAVDHGAGVILVPLALGSGATLLEDAVEYAAAHDALVIAPTGTGGNNEVLLPAALPSCVAVSATTNQDLPAPFSNYGGEVDLSAPGENIWSTLPETSFGFRSYTASAAAHVAGVAALIRSFAPQLSVDEVRDVLLVSADDLGPPGWDNRFGAGRLNAGRALATAPRPPLRFEHPGPIGATSPFESPILVRILEGTESLAPGSARVWFRTAEDDAYESTPLIPQADPTFEFQLPERACRREVEFYFEARSIAGTLVTSPWNAPVRRFRTVAASLDEIFFDDFETERGWTTASLGEATAGAWIRGTPQGGSGQPGFDFSRGGGQRCFVTGQTSGVDVDDGPVLLQSPPVEVPAGDVEVHFAAWVYSAGGVGSPDALTAWATVDGETGWTLVLTVPPDSLATVQWREHRIRLRDWGLDAGGPLQVRFEIADPGNDSFTEAAVDDFGVRILTCPARRGDVDGNGTVDLSDYATFAACMIGPSAGYRSGCRSSDLDASGRVNLADFASLQNVLGVR